MLKLPCCNVCKNRIGEMEDRVCKAYPDGIPQEIIDYIEEDKLVDCGKGYSFTEKINYLKKEPDSGGFLSKLEDAIGRFAE